MQESYRQDTQLPSWWDILTDPDPWRDGGAVGRGQGSRTNGQVLGRPAK